jgi:hypothetical protein
MRRFLCLSLLVTLLFALPGRAEAWNREGHMVVAAIAYRRLAPATKAKVNRLLALHPKYQTWVAGLPEDQEVRGLAAFQMAARWPDDIKDGPDKALFDGDDAPPKPLVSGYPSMKRHNSWHYIDLPIARGGAKPECYPPTNGLAILPVLLDEMTNPLSSDAMKAYDLPWIVHIAGDLHQPLHCAQLFSPNYPKGDAGGNAFKLKFAEGQPENLHWYWDASVIVGDAATATPTATFAVVDTLSRALEQETPAEATPVLDPMGWVREGAALADSVVYTLPEGTEANRTEVTPAYATATRALARKRMALAGYRLAALLDARLAN